MELVLVHRIEKLSSDPAVIGRILISRRDYVLCWRLELAKTGKVLFDVGENSISLACRQAVPDAFQAFAFDVGHLNFSRGNARRTFGYEAYHWGIIIMPEGSQERDCIAFEATDASAIDPVTFRMNNPTMDWFMRRKDESDPEFGTKLLGRIIIGQVPDAISNVQLEALFGTVPLPVKNTHPQQSCVTWAIDAIRVLQKQGWASQFELNGFKDWALYYADERIKTGLSREPEIAYYRV